MGQTNMYLKRDLVGYWRITVHMYPHPVPLLGHTPFPYVSTPCSSTRSCPLPICIHPLFLYSVMPPSHMYPHPVPLLGHAPFPSLLLLICSRLFWAKSSPLQIPQPSLPCYPSCLDNLRRWNRVFRNVGTENSEGGEWPKRKNTT